MLQKYLSSASSYNVLHTDEASSVLEFTTKNNLESLFTLIAELSIRLNYEPI
jgi:hypothetical protein